MILKLENEMLHSWDIIDNAQDVRIHRRNYIVKSEPRENPSGGENHFFCVAEDKPDDHIECVTFLVDASLAIEHNWKLKIVSCYRPTSKEEVTPPQFFAYNHGYLLNDEGKTIDHI